MKMCFIMYKAQAPRLANPESKRAVSDSFLSLALSLALRPARELRTRPFVKMENLATCPSGKPHSNKRRLEPVCEVEEA